MSSIGKFPVVKQIGLCNISSPPVPARPEPLPGDSVLSLLVVWWRNRHKTRKALTALGNDEICHLSETGRRIRREESAKGGALPRSRPDLDSNSEPAF